MRKKVHTGECGGPQGKASQATTNDLVSLGQRPQLAGTALLERVVDTVLKAWRGAAGAAQKLAAGVARGTASPRPQERGRVRAWT